MIAALSCLSSPSSFFYSCLFLVIVSTTFDLFHSLTLINPHKLCISVDACCIHHDPFARYALSRQSPPPSSFSLFLLNSIQSDPPTLHVPLLSMIIYYYYYYLPTFNSLPFWFFYLLPFHSRIPSTLMFCFCLILSLFPFLFFSDLFFFLFV